MLRWVVSLQAFIGLLKQCHILQNLIQLDQLKYEEIMIKIYTYEELKAMGVKPIIQMSPSISGVKRCNSILLSNNNFSSEIKTYNGYNIETCSK